MSRDGRLLIGYITKYLFSKLDASDIWLAIRRGCSQFVGPAKVKPREGHILDTCAVSGSRERRS